MPQRRRERTPEQRAAIKRHTRDLDILVEALRKSEDLDNLNAREEGAFRRALVFVRVVDEARHPVPYLIEKVKNRQYWRKHQEPAPYVDPLSDEEIRQRRQRALAKYTK